MSGKFFADRLLQTSVFLLQLRRERRGLCAAAKVGYLRRALREYLTQREHLPVVQLQPFAKSGHQRLECLRRHRGDSGDGQRKYKKSRQQQTAIYSHKSTSREGCRRQLYTKRVIYRGRLKSPVGAECL